LIIRPPPRLSLFPYTTLFRSDLHVIEQKRNAVNSHRALEAWVPMIAAIGAMIISAMLLFKGLKHVHLGLSTLDNYLIMGMIGARSEEHTSELQSRENLVCRLL